MIYLDHNATSPVLPEVVNAMLPYFTHKAGNPSSVHGAGRSAREGLDMARRQVATALSVRDSQVIFTSGGSEANNLAILGMAGQTYWRGKIITSQVEHPSVLQPCLYCEQQGMEVVRLPVNQQGLVSLEGLGQALTPDTVLVSIMHANNETGVLQPIAELAALCQQAGIPFHCDAVQTVGKIPVQMADLGVQLLSLSGHKFGGPKGAGALLVDGRLTLQPRILGGGQERGRRAGTENVPALVGLAHALLASQKNMASEMERLSSLRHDLEEALTRSLPQAVILGRETPRLPNTTALLLPGMDGETLVMSLDLAGLAVSSGSACSSGKASSSHVATAMGFSHSMASGLLRISMGWNTKPEEIQRLVPTLTKTVNKLASLSGIKGYG
ncbi:MAG: cysteine desulfurase [Magnetococcales bacterium]|nr:cysteine desulfurase [Magnetococcales bacterium]NGZ27536.1 cysteine desulfurase [Magnetococcales bacterium]